MSNTRYIEISSEYRNRNDWPLPSEFEVSISRSGVCDKTTARDPVSDCTPVTSWVATNLNKGGASTLALTVLTSGVGDTGDFQTVFVSATTLQQEENYYVGLIGEDSVPTYRRVTGYRYLGNTGAVDRGEFIFDGAFPVGTATITLTDPTDVTIASNMQFFVPNGRSGTNSYPNCVLYNETRGQSAPILTYSFTTHLLEVNGTLTSSWNVSDAYSIRKCVPSFTGLTASTDVISTSLLNLPLGSNTQNGFYEGDYLRVANTIPTVPVVAPINETVRISKYLALDTNFSTAPGVTNTFTLAGGSNVNNYYVGGRLLTAINLTPGYEVLTYDGATRTGTISGVFGGETAGTVVRMRSAWVSPAFTVIPTTYFAGIELLPFSRDNYNTLMYSGSTVSQSEMVCYEVELMNLVLPNRTLAVGQGSRIAFYPYVYVELTNVSSASAGTRNILYSNNPNSSRMLFRAPIDDIPNPVVSSFIKIDSDGTVQTVKFKPNDTLHFSVHLPNGELYQTVLSENFSPLPPNAENQISALFAIKKL